MRLLSTLTAGWFWGEGKREQQRVQSLVPHPWSPLRAAAAARAAVSEDNPCGMLAKRIRGSFLSWTPTILQGSSVTLELTLWMEQPLLGGCLGRGGCGVGRVPLLSTEPLFTGIPLHPCRDQHHNQHPKSILVPFQSLQGT